MKLTTLLLLTLFHAPTGYLTGSREKLGLLQADKKITGEQFDLFSKQLDYRTRINLQSRIDSMESWNLDLLYIEEYYFPKTDSFLVKEYYFSTASEKEGGKSEYERSSKNYGPEKHYENGKRAPAYTYFFRHENGKENLASIRKHIKTKNTIDRISPVVKKEIVTVGCGTFPKIDAKYIANEKKHTEKKYNKPRTPDYYLIETFIEKNEFIVSFQIPVKTNYQVIVEAHPF